MGRVQNAALRVSVPVARRHDPYREIRAAAKALNHRGRLRPWATTYGELHTLEAMFYVADALRDGAFAPLAYLYAGMR